MEEPTSLYLVHIEELRALESGGTEIGGLQIEEGALPPMFIIKAAIADLESGRDPLWCSFFLFVKDGQERAVGSGGFRGLPANGRVEIGYGVAASHRGRGVATEAAILLLKQAFALSEVFEVFAETSVQNIPSRRVVEKAGFQKIGQRESQSDGLLDQWLAVR